MVPLSPDSGSTTVQGVHAFVWSLAKPARADGQRVVGHLFLRLGASGGPKQDGVKESARKNREYWLYSSQF